MWIVGRKFYEGYKFRLMCNLNEKFEPSFPDECLSLVLLEEGTLIFSLNGKNAAVTAPCVLCFNNRDVYSVKNLSSQKAMSLYFHPEVVNSDFNLENIYPGFENSFKGTTYQDGSLLMAFTVRDSDYLGCIDVGISTLQKLKLLFEKIDTEVRMQRDSFWPCRSRSYLFEVLIILQGLYLDKAYEDSSITIEKASNGMEPVLEFLHTNYGTNISVKDLAKTFNINRTTLNQHFLELTGSTVISYLIKHRLKVAGRFLKDTELPVNEISQRVGFNDVTSFTRSFKKHYNLPPSSFRKQEALIRV